MDSMSVSYKYVITVKLNAVIREFILPHISMR